MKRVLIVDDNAENLYLLRVLLQGHGYTVDEARNGVEAMAKGRQSCPELIISDLLMPVVDGYTLLRQLRADETLKNIPFVVYTATYTEPRDERLALALGADAFILKPDEPESFMARINSVLEKRKRGELPAARPQPDELILLKEYNEVLVHKLEKKALQLEQSNRDLLKENADRKAAEEEVRLSMTLRRIAGQAARMGGWMFDILKQKVVWSDEIRAIHEVPAGYAPTLEEAINFYAPEYRSQVADVVSACAKNGTPFNFELELVTAKGRRLWVRSIGEASRDSAGRIVALQGAFQDITEQKKAEEELRLRDRAIQSVSQGIAITDSNLPDNPLVYVSPGFERITGYRADEVLGRNCRFLQGQETDKDSIGKLRKALASGTACAVEILNYKKDGTTFWNELSLNPVRDGNGDLAYFVGVQNDVTVRKKLEEQLRQSQKMEAIGLLAGGVAHDFNNLLTIISGYSHVLLARTDLNPGVREKLGTIKEAGSRAAALTRQLLAFSRQAVLQPKVVDLNVVVFETSKMLQRLIGEDICLTTVLEPDVGRIKVDPSQLDQILMNLVINARDAMPKGGKLTIETKNFVLSEEFSSTHLDSKPGPHVMLAITDTGCGMPPETLSRIFEPFYTTKEVGKGTGLGLAMVFGIVQQSGGCIHVYSEVGHGTTFKLYFPVVAEALTRKSDQHTAAKVLGTETILLVEDEGGVRELSLSILQSHGYKVLSATNGQDALKISQNHSGPLDLVLTDVVMPAMSGPDLVRATKDRFPKLKVLYMSGYTDDTVVRHGLLSGEANFIQKPFTPHGLVQKVRQVLDEKILSA